MPLAAFGLCHEAASSPCVGKVTLLSPTSLQASDTPTPPCPLASRGTGGLQQDPWTGHPQGLAKPVCQVTRASAHLTTG